MFDDIFELVKSILPYSLFWKKSMIDSWINNISELLTQVYAVIETYLRFKLQLIFNSLTLYLKTLGLYKAVGDYINTKTAIFKKFLIANKLFSNYKFTSNQREDLLVDCINDLKKICSVFQLKSFNIYWDKRF